MAEMLEEQRENWGTRGGFVLAAVGSAVGLGNLWGFPYKLYDHGGGAFLIPYIVAIFVVGIPVMILEFGMGHMTQRAAPEAFRRVNKRFEVVGWWGILLGFAIITFYPVILAWCCSFFWFSVKSIVTSQALPWAGVGIEGVENARSFFFDTYLNYNGSTQLGAFQHHLLWPLVITWVLMYFCIFKGVSLVGRIVWLTVPLPWLMLLVLAVRGLTLEGAIQGLGYYLNPDFTELLKPQTWQFAFGQAFFSLSLAFGVMITYASFLHRKSDINNNAAIIGLADFATSFLAGLAVFATLGAMAYATQQAGQPVGVNDVVDGGVGLAFVAFPYALAQLPASAWWSAVFFFTLITLGIDSGFSITESVLASVVDKTGWPRSIVLPLMSIAGLGIGLVFITSGGLSWLDVIATFIYGTWGITLLGLLECLVIGWLWRVERLRRHANLSSDWKVHGIWNVLISAVIPIILTTLFVWSLFEDITREGGFLIESQSGDIIWTTAVGLGVMIAAPICAVVLSLIKSPTRRDGIELHPTEPEVKGRVMGNFYLLFSLIGMACVVFLFGRLLKGELAGFWHFVSAAALFFGGFAVIGAWVCIKLNDSKTSRASFRSRWGGLIGALDLGGFIAIELINFTRYSGIEDRTADAVERGSMGLTGVSYLILAFVFFVIILGMGWCFYKAFEKK